MYTFTVKGFDSKGALVTAQHYDTQKLHALNGHWQVVDRMAETVKKSRKVKTVRFYMNGVEHVWNTKSLEWKAV